MPIRKKAKWVFTTVCLFAMTTSPALAEWSQFQGDAGHTGYAAGSINAPSLIPLWSIDAPDYSARPGDRSVAIVDGKVYATMLDGYGARGPYLLSSFNGQDGSLLWQQAVPANSHSGVSAPTIAGDRVYVHHWGHSGSSGSSFPEDYPALVGFDADTGDQLFWTIHSGQWNSGSRPTVLGDQVFAAGGYYGGLDAYSLDGDPLWFHKVNQQYGWIPAADDDNVYVYMGEASASPGPSTGSLFVIDRVTGQRRSTILHPTSDGTMYGQLQSVMLGGRDDALALTFNDHSARDDSRTLVSFDISGESILWERQGEFSGNPAVANGIIAIPDEDVLRFLDQNTGTDLWTWSGGSVEGNVVLTDDYAFVNASDAVHAIDLQTQQSVWSVDGLTGNLALDDGLLVVSNPEGVYAYAETSSFTPEPVPEPLTILGSATALGFGALFKCQSSKKQKDKSKVKMDS